MSVCFFLLIMHIPTFIALCLQLLLFVVPVVETAFYNNIIIKTRTTQSTTGVSIFSDCSSSRYPFRSSLLLISTSSSSSSYSKRKYLSQIRNNRNQNEHDELNMISTTDIVIGKEEDEEQQQQLDRARVGSQFLILTCSSAACTTQRRRMGLDEFATYSALYERIMQQPQQIEDDDEEQQQQEQYGVVRIEECPCLGSCALAPCVAVEHDDYDGPVALLGMNDKEFMSKTFHKINDEADIDRIWDCVNNAITLMIEEENEEE